MELGGPTPLGARKANLTERTLPFMEEVALNEQVRAFTVPMKLEMPTKPCFPKGSAMLLRVLLLYCWMSVRAVQLPTTIYYVFCFCFYSSISYAAGARAADARSGVCVTLPRHRLCRRCVFDMQVHLTSENALYYSTSFLRNILASAVSPTSAFLSCQAAFCFDRLQRLHGCCVQPERHGPGGLRHSLR